MLSTVCSAGPTRQIGMESAFTDACVAPPMFECSLPELPWDGDTIELEAELTPSGRETIGLSRRRASQPFGSSTKISCNVMSLRRSIIRSTPCTATSGPNEQESALDPQQAPAHA